MPLSRAPPKALKDWPTAVLQAIPADEPHDLDRLGYHLFLWLTNRQDPLEAVVPRPVCECISAKKRPLGRIREYLTAHGVKL